MYLPWVLLGWTLLLGGIPIIEFIGIVVGHLYYFLEHLYPATSGVHLLQTPSFLSVPFSFFFLFVKSREPVVFMISCFSFSQASVLSR